MHVWKEFPEFCGRYGRTACKYRRWRRHDRELQDCRGCKRAALEILRNHFQGLTESEAETGSRDDLRDTGGKGYQAFQHQPLAQRAYSSHQDRRPFIEKPRRPGFYGCDQPRDMPSWKHEGLGRYGDSHRSRGYPEEVRHKVWSVSAGCMMGASMR